MPDGTVSLKRRRCKDEPLEGMFGPLGLWLCYLRDPAAGEGVQGMFLIPFPLPVPARIDAEDCCVGLQRLNVPHCAARERIADLSVGVVAVAGIPFAWAIWHFFNTLLRDARWFFSRKASPSKSHRL